jgi:hypothetical protein
LVDQSAQQIGLPVDQDFQNPDLSVSKSANFIITQYVLQQLIIPDIK